MMQIMLQNIGWQESYVRMSLEANRIKIVAMKEQTDRDAALDEEDALWDLEVFQYGANVLAAISGGTSSPKVKEPSALQSALGGAMSGAAAGWMIGGGYGAAIGAVIGAAASFL